MSYVLYCQCARRPGRGESQSARRREPEAGEAERAKTACAVQECMSHGGLARVFTIQYCVSTMHASSQAASR